MSKYFAVVLVLVSFSSMSFAQDSLDMPLLSVGQFSVKNIVKAKLWYEGVEISKSERAELDEQLEDSMPEEILIALEKF